MSARTNTHGDQPAPEAKTNTNLGVVELERVLHADRVADAHEVVVPAVVLRHHEEPEEPVRQEHLHLTQGKAKQKKGEVLTQLKRL